MHYLSRRVRAGDTVPEFEGARGHAPEALPCAAAALGVSAVRAGNLAFSDVYEVMMECI